MAVRIFHRDSPSAKMPMIAKDARLIVWPGSGSRTANMNYVVLEAGESNIPHAHPKSEDTIFLLSGYGTVEDLTNDFEIEIRAGHAIHIPAGVVHAVKADRGVPLESVGGPSPPDAELLKRLGLKSEP